MNNSISNIGWWQVDLKNQQILFSNNLVKEFGFETNCIHLNILINGINDDDKERIKRGIIKGTANPKRLFCDEYTITCPLGEKWIRIRSLDSSEHPGLMMGTIETLERNTTNELLQNMPVGYISIALIRNDDGHIIDYYVDTINPTARILHDLDTDILGLPSKELSNPDEFYFILNYFKSLVKSKKKDVGLKTIEKTGKHCNYEVYAYENERILYCIQDVTDEVLAKEKLEKETSHLYQLLKNLPIGVEIYDKNGVLQNYNAHNREIFGVVSDEEINGLNLFEDPNFSDKIKSDIKTQDKTIFSYDYDFNLVRKQVTTWKSKSIKLLSITNKVYDTNGNLTNYILTNIDRTQIENAYERIQELESTFNIITQWKGINYSYQSLSNNTAEIIKTLGNVHPEDEELVYNTIERFRDEKEGNLSKDIRLLDEQGEVKWIKLSLIKDKEEILALSYDITNLKNKESILALEKEKAEESNTIKANFLADMSHEIRTPLNSIIGFSGILSECIDPEEKDNYSKIVRENSELLLQLISDILDISKIEAGALDFTLRSVSAKQLCQEIESSVRIPTKNVEFILKTPVQDQIINCPPDRVKQVLTNYIQNSAKFTQNGHIILGYESLPDHKIKFYVEDTGCGIPKEDLKNIFHRFTKVNKFSQGTGLGLSICSSIADRINAEVGIDSEEGRGTIAWLILNQ